MMASTCQASLVSPKQHIVSILVWFVDATHVTVMPYNIIETRRRGARGATTLDFDQTKALWAF